MKYCRPLKSVRGALVVMAGLAFAAGAGAADYWTTFNVPATDNTMVNPVQGTLHGATVTVTNQSAVAGTNPMWISTPPFTVSTVAFYPASLKAMTNHLVRVPRAGATAASPQVAEISFAAPVVDPLVAFYSLDNSAVSVQSSTDMSGAPADVETLANRTNMIGVPAAGWVSGWDPDPSLVAVRTEGCFVDPDSKRVCGMFRLKGVYTEIQLGQFLTSGGSDGVGFQIGLSLTPAPQPDAGTTQAGVTRVVISDLRTNDRLVGARGTELAATGANATVAVVGAWPTGISLNPATGGVTVDSTVAVGTYTMSYLLCDAADATNCAESTVQITVAAPAPVPTLPATGLVTLAGLLAWLGMRARRGQR